MTEDARVRWLVICQDPLDGPLKLDRAGFPKLMADASKAVTVEVEDRLGSQGRRSFQAHPEQLSHFRLKEIVERTEPLGALSALAQTVSGPAEQRPTAEELVQKIEALVGAGKLSETVQAAKPPEPAPEPAPKKALDGFISAIRTDQKPSLKAAHRAIEDAIYATAKDLLASEALSQKEGFWRGLKFLVEQCPADAYVEIELVSRPVEQINETLQTYFEREAFERPDAVFILSPIEDEKHLTAFAESAEVGLCPVVVQVGEALLGEMEPSKLIQRLEDSPPEAWTTVQNNEASRWLCAVLNKVVLHAEGTGQARRSVLGSPVLALAAMLSRSFARTGSFALLLGPEGALASPSVHILAEGQYEGISVPTEHFVSAKRQGELKAFGLLALGSARNNDKLRLSQAPTASGSEDAVPLPAQLLTGRIVRFAQWVTEQIPAGTADEDIPGFFQQAASVFLFPGMEKTAEVTAKAAEYEGQRQVVVAARVRPIHAGVPLELTFSLPLPA